MPKKTSTAAGSLGEGTPVNVPVSVTTVWAEAVAREAAKNNDANAKHAVRPRAELSSMEILLSGPEGDVNAAKFTFRIVAVP